MPEGVERGGGVGPRGVVTVGVAYPRVLRGISYESSPFLLWVGLRVNIERLVQLQKPEESEQKARCIPENPCRYLVVYRAIGQLEAVK